jgi:hypothetical protein
VQTKMLTLFFSLSQERCCNSNSYLSRFQLSEMEIHMVATSQPDLLSLFTNIYLLISNVPGFTYASSARLRLAQHCSQFDRI